LFGLSFIVPNTGGSFGFAAFFVTAQTVFGMCADGEVFRSWDSARLAFALGFGWISNSSVFFRPPLVVAAAMMTAPWVIFAAFLFFHPEQPDTSVVTFIPFYPWALGIGLVNYARIVYLRKNSAYA
jgi:hypothetical protein